MSRDGVAAAAVAALIAGGLGGCCARPHGATTPGPRVLTRGGLTYALAVAPDGALLSVELGERFELVTRDGATGAARARRGLGPAERDVATVAAAPDGTVYWASEDGAIHGGDRDLPLGAPATAVAVSDDGRWLASGDETGVVCLRRRADVALLQCTAIHAERIAALAFAPGSGALASASWDGEVIVWEVPSLAIRARVAGEPATALAFSADGARLAIGRAAEPPRRTPETEARLRTGELGEGTVEVVELGGAAAVASAGAAATATGTATVAWRRRGHRGPTTAVGWLGAAVVSGGWDGDLRRWDDRGSRTLHHSANQIQALAITAGHVAVGLWARALDDASLILVNPQP